MTELPTIDLRLLCEPGGAEFLAAEVDRVCREWGFLKVVGHGIAPETFEAVYESMLAVVALSADDKARLASPQGHPFRGLVSNRNAASGVAVERFQVNHFDHAHDALAAGIDESYGDYFVPNVWPKLVEGFQSAWLTCFDQTRQVGNCLMSVFAMALGLDPRFFEPLLANDVSCFAVNAYPPQPVTEAGRDVIFFGHTDSGTLTLLHQRGDYAGLQIEDPSGVWMDGRARRPRRAHHQHRRPDGALDQ